MKSASPKFSLVLFSAAALLLAGCPKKPVRPSPDATMLGQGGSSSGGTGALTAENQNPPGLETREGDSNGQIRGKLEPVYFDFDRSTVKASERTKLTAAKDYLDKNAQYRLLLEGHCDWRGTAEYNLALGDRRANEAKKYLVSIGVASDKLDTLSKGSEEAAKNAKGEAAAKDRRVELVLLVPGAAPVTPSNPTAPAGGLSAPSAPASGGAAPATSP